MPLLVMHILLLQVAGMSPARPVELLSVGYHREVLLLRTCMVRLTDALAHQKIICDYVNSFLFIHFAINK